MSINISTINCKGGSGKTTTTVNLAAALASKKLKILVVDLDPQCSASISFGFKRSDLYPSIADVLIEGIDAKECIKQTKIKGVDLITGSIELSSFDVMFSNKEDREYKLKEVLKDISQDYHVIIQDCPPTLGLLVVNAIMNSNYLLIPILAQYLSLEGLSTLLEAVERIESGMGHKVEILGILLTQVDRRSNATKEIITLIRDHYKNIVFKTEIANSIRISEAPSHGKTIFEHDLFSIGSQGYMSLADEIFPRLKREKSL